MNVTKGMRVLIKNNSIFKEHFKLDQVTGDVLSVTLFGVGFACNETGRVEQVAFGDGEWSVLDTAEPITSPEVEPEAPAPVVTEAPTPEPVAEEQPQPMPDVPRGTLIDVSTAAGLGEAYSAIVDAAGGAPDYQGAVRDDSDRDALMGDLQHTRDAVAFLIAGTKELATRFDSQQGKLDQLTKDVGDLLKAMQHLAHEHEALKARAATPAKPTAKPAPVTSPLPAPTTGAKANGSKYTPIKL